MKHLATITCLFFIFSFSAFSQNKITVKKADTLNQYNPKHQKNGFWVVYLDSMASPTDSAKSVFYAYQYFDNGFAVYIYQYKGRKKRSLSSTCKSGEPGKPILLEGNMKIYWKGDIEYDETFFNGKPVIMNAYRCNREHEIVMHEFLNFAIPYKNERGTFYYEKRGYKEEVLQCAFFRKGIKNYDIQPTACKK